MKKRMKRGTVCITGFDALVFAVDDGREFDSHRFNVDGRTPAELAELLREAADWLEVHEDEHVLVAAE